MSESKDPLVGKTLGGYRLDALLSRGLSGRLYRARQISVERNVALKLLSPKLAGDGAFITRFLEETRAAAKLNHPNVVQIHDVVRSPKVTFYSMEYLPGGSLLDWVRRQGPLPWRTLATQLRDVADALSYAEKKGIVHGYLSPSNLLFTQDSRLKVLNLGLGGRHDAQAKEDGKRKPPAGVLPFMAPESIMDGSGDHRSDIYALGCTFFFGFSGRPPFEGKTAKEVFSAKMLRDPPELADTVEGLPEWLSDLIQQMLVRDPDQRPQSFEEIVGVLEKHLGRAAKAKGKKKGGGRGRRAGPSSRSRSRSRSSSRGSRPGFLETPQGMVAVGAAALVLIIVLVAAFSGEGDSSESRSSSSGETVASRSSNGTTSSSGTETGREDGTSRARPGAREDGGGAGGKSGAGGKNGRADEGTASLERRPGESIQEYRERMKAELANQAPATGKNSRGFLLLESRAIEWEKAPPTVAEAVAVITAIKQQYPEPAVAKRADEILEDVARRARQREIREAVDEELGPELASKNYAMAVEKLDALGRKYPGSEDIAEERARVEAAAEEELRSVEQEASGLSRAGEFDRAIALLDELQGRLPPKLRPKAEERLAELVESRDSAGEVASEFAEAESRLSELVARLDFAAAKEVLDSLPGSSHPLHAERRERVIAEVKKAEEAWSALSRGLEQAGGERFAIGVDPFLAAGGTFPGTIEDHEKTDGKVNVTVGKHRSKNIECGLFDLHDATLFEIIGKGGAEVTPSLVEGLGILLFHHEGAKRAWSVLVRHPDVPGGKKDLYAVRLREAGQDALSREIESLETEVGAAGFEAGSSPKAAKVDNLVRRVESAVARHRGLPYYAGFRGRLAKLYDTVHKAKLRSDGAQGFFRGDAEILRDGKVKIAYDFSSEDQAEDFHSKENSVKISGRKTLVVREECRLLKGNPFKDSIEVTAKVASYEKVTPNVNIALWTHEEDTVTYRSVRSSTGVTTSTVSNSTPSGSNDYLAFGVGYAPGNISYLSGRTIRMLDSGHRVALPAFVIIGGKRGEPLPYYYSYYGYDGNCFWAESSYRDIKGQPLTIWIAHSPSGFRWRCNGIKLSGKALNTAPGVKDWLAKEDATGSITIFTYGHRVEFASLVIEAEPNPWWIEEEIERRAKGAFDEMEKRYSTL